MSDVPAFLKGNHGPVYRAAGGGGVCAEAFSRSQSPAPLQFDKLDNQWHSFSAEPAPKVSSKTSKLEGGLGFRANLESLGAHMDILAVKEEAEVFDLTNSDDEAEPLPSDLSRNSILLDCNTDSTELLRELALLFDRNVDFDMDFRLGQIRGVSHNKSDRCQFVIQVHQLPSSERRALVFFRHSGSAPLFSRLLASTRSGLGQASFCALVKPEATAAAGVSGGAAVDVGAWAFEDMELDAESCQQLVGMCSSEFVDVQREALSTLGTLVSSPQACRELQTHSGSELVTALAKAGQAQDDEVRWLCAFVASHLCAVPAFLPQALALVPTLFGLLATGPALEGRGCKRQAARGLERITKAQGTAVLRQTGRYLGVLEELFHDNDQVLRASIRLIVQQLTSTE